MDDTNWETLDGNEVIATLDDSKLPGMTVPTMRAKELIQYVDSRLNRWPQSLFVDLGFLCQRLRPNSEWQRGWLRIKVEVSIEFRPDPSQNS